MHTISLKVIAPRFSVPLEAHYFGMDNFKDALGPPLIWRDHAQRKVSKHPPIKILKGNREPSKAQVHFWLLFSGKLMQPQLHSPLRQQRVLPEYWGPLQRYPGLVSQVWLQFVQSLHVTQGSLHKEEQDQLMDSNSFFNITQSPQNFFISCQTVWYSQS